LVQLSSWCLAVRGMTTSNKPISLAGPVDADVLRTAELNKFLVEAELYETVEESTRREEVLGELDKIVKVWVKQLTSQRGYTDQMVEEANAVLFTFGSYRLGDLGLISTHYVLGLHMLIARRTSLLYCMTYYRKQRK